MVRLEPINDYVIVKRLESEVNVQGIVLPEQESQQIIKGEVIAVGPGKPVEGSVHERHEMQCKVGDIVLVNSLACAPQRLPLDMEGEYMLIPERDIAAIIRED